MVAENLLLNALAPELYESLLPHLHQVTLTQGHRIYEPNEPITDLYFPLNCAISIVVTMHDGRTAEIGIAGNRELVGINAFLGGNTAQMTYMVQLPGDALRIDANIIVKEFNRNQQMQTIILRYIQAFIAQVSQNAACNGLHQTEQRLARWLLEVQDRVEQNHFKLTQEFMADMLGTRRSGVTQTAQKLQENGLIRYHRGKLEILDLPGLEACSCECFRTIKHQYDRLFQ
jgi:CRP-like cAMP-binding protein